MWTAASCVLAASPVSGSGAPSTPVTDEPEQRPLLGVRDVPPARPGAGPPSRGGVGAAASGWSRHSSRQRGDTEPAWLCSPRPAAEFAGADGLAMVVFNLAAFTAPCGCRVGQRWALGGCFVGGRGVTSSTCVDAEAGFPEQEAVEPDLEQVGVHQRGGQGSVNEAGRAQRAGLRRGGRALPQELAFLLSCRSGQAWRFIGRSLISRRSGPDTQSGRGAREGVCGLGLGPLTGPPWD